MADHNKKHYFIVIDKDELKAVALDHTEDKGLVQLWMQGQSEDTVEEFEAHSFDEKKPSLYLKSTAKLLALLKMSSLLDEEVFLKMTVGKYHYFTYGKLGYDKAKKLYELPLENDIYRGQQRSNYRLMASSHIKIQFKVGEVVHHCQDISAGGTSFFVPTSDADAFVKDDLHEDCALLFCGKRYEIPKTRIAGKWDAETKDPHMKIGVAFIDLPPQIEEDLYRQVNSEARGEEVRKKLAERKAKQS